MTDNETAHTGVEYPCGTLTQMAAIPEDVLPRFLAELPAAIRHARLMHEAAHAIAEETHAKLKWYWKWIPVKTIARSVQIGLNRAKWADDDKQLVTMRIRHRGETLTMRTARLDAGYDGLDEALGNALRTLTKAYQTFLHYETLHWAKGTLDGDDKARANAALADEMLGTMTEVTVAIAQRKQEAALG